MSKPTQVLNRTASVSGRKSIKPTGWPTALLPGNLNRRQIIWSTCTDRGWEILIYRKGEHYEACFFRWARHHEHLAGVTYDSLIEQVHRRINKLEAGSLQKTVR